MAPPSLVILNRRFDDDQERDGLTPTAHGFSDYDEGDILDELLQEAPQSEAAVAATAAAAAAAAPRSRSATITALSTEALQSRNASRPLLSPSSASVCSSTTAAEDEFDREDNDGNHDDTASITSNTSVSVGGRSAGTSSGRSSCIAPSSTASPKMPPAAINAGLAGTGSRRRRRRNNHRGAGAAAGVAASDAGSESMARPERERGTGQQAKQRRGTTAQSQPQQEKAAAAPVATEDSTKNSKQTTKKSKKMKPVATSTARRSRHPRLQIGLDLDVELELKSKVRGDICLTLV